ncbi:DUF4992 family lipoprotein [Bacteroides thetaiotaomicron]|uniref:DUF4992 family lipoprotein n=1 Tax=Bacteroides thetaiotaomicron TaxID=818 RepID=UPI0021661A26|nr:DUF4992 family lipoprotein [Bacteroides thetaiotaomicron]MCS2720073.1 DUF4992 family lipoprotein [Bacteroides thetaiotaomicron]UVS24181.1 DUF4992 family lipoprotein [Bacteroides thetaiotaomicron]
MKSNRLFLRRRTRGLLFATLLFLLSSCTIGYHEDESFESDVKKCYTGISPIGECKSGT